MKLDSKNLPLIAGALVLGLAGLFFVGRGLVAPSRTASAPSSSAGGANAPDEPMSQVEQEAREAVRRGQTDEAIRLLEAVPPTSPDFVTTRLPLAVILDGAGHAEQALAAVETFLSVRAEDPEAQYVRCRALYQLGRVADAERACLRAVEIAPGHAPARYALGLIRLASGHTNAAIEAYIRAMRVAGGQTPVLDALRDLTVLQKARPDLAEVHYVMAFFAGSLGTTSEEIVELERYLAAAPTGPVAETARRKLAELKR